MTYRIASLEDAEAVQSYWRLKGIIWDSGTLNPDNLVVALDSEGIIIGAVYLLVDTLYVTASECWSTCGTFSLHEAVRYFYSVRGLDPKLRCIGFIDVDNKRFIASELKRRGSELVKIAIEVAFNVA